MYGTLPLCDEHDARFREDILQRRPDLRVPRLIGQLPDEPATWRCEACGAGWFSSEAIPCPWCEQRPELDRQIQQSIDEGRLQDYLRDVEEGNEDAVIACSNLLKVAIPRGTLPTQAMRQLRDAISEAEAA